MTAAELLYVPEIECRYELVRGELKRRSFNGARHGRISHNISMHLGSHVEANALGLVVGPCGFILAENPDTVRAPDIAFVRSDRAVVTEEYFPEAPDLAVEIVSFSNEAAGVDEKIGEYLSAGGHAVVVVNSKTQRVAVHRRTGTTEILETLTVDEVVPGWTLSLAEIFKS